MVSMYIDASRYLRLSRAVKSNVPILGRDCLDWFFFICTTKVELERDGVVFSVL